jgi:Kelch motif
MRALAACLALSALLLAGCTVGPRPGNWESLATGPDLARVDRLVSVPRGAVVAIGVTPDHHIAVAVFDGPHSAWLPSVESPLITGTPDASALADGDVLITSPEGDWRFRPSDAGWQPAAAMNHRRFGYASSSLADGRLLACGGSDVAGLSLASCEIYDPAADRWVPSASMSTRRFGALAATFPDGRVFVTGGAFNTGPALDGSMNLTLNPLDTSETFNPATAAFSPGPAYLDPVTDPTLVGLPNGMLLAIGGRQGRFPRTTTSQELDPRTGRWSLRAAPTAQGAGVLLPDGRVLVIGRGSGQGFFGPGGGAIYDPGIDLWTPITPPPSDRYPGLTALLPDGRVLTVSFGAPPASAIFDPQALPPLPGRDLPLASRAAVLGLAGLVGALLILVMVRAGWRTR